MKQTFTSSIDKEVQKVTGTFSYCEVFRTLLDGGFKDDQTNF